MYDKGNNFEISFLEDVDVDEALSYVTVIGAD